MIDAIVSLFSWMPLALQIVCGGALFIFVLSIILQIWAFIKDLIPFL